MGGPEAAGESFAAPPPPIALFAAELGVLSLGHGATKDVEHAGVLALSCLGFELAVESLSIATRQGFNRRYVEQFKVLEHGLADAVEVA